MYLLLETIKVADRKLQNIDLHNERLNHSRKEIWGIDSRLALEKIIQIPDNVDNGIFKCRVLYGKEIEKVAFLPYQIKPIESLLIVEADQISYAYKFADRQEIEKLMPDSALAKTDILITQKGLIKDTSYANIVFFDGKKYITPLTPLLKGTKRELLLRKGQLIAQEISVQDLKKFQFAKIINAMIDLEESPIISISAIN